MYSFSEGQTDSIAARDNHFGRSDDINNSLIVICSVWAVFDGHGSTAISSYLQAALPVYLRRQLCNVTEAFGAEDNDGEDADIFSRWVYDAVVYHDVYVGRAVG